MGEEIFASTTSSTTGLIEVFTKYITKNNKRIYHPDGGVYHFFVKPDKEKE